MMPFIYLVIFVTITLLVVAFVFESYVIGVIMAMLMIVEGIYIARTGLIGLNNLVTEALALILIAIGAYVFLLGTYQELESLHI